MTMPPGGYPGQPQDPQQPERFPPPGGFPPPGNAGTPGGHGDPGGPQHGGPQYGGPQYGGPQSGGPQSGGPQHGGPQSGGPQYGDPQSGGPQSGGWAPAPTPRSNRTPLIIAVLAVLAVVLSGAAWAVTRGGNDPKAQADKFMTAVQHGNLDDARKLLCKDGRDKFGTAGELREQMVGSGEIAGFTSGGVSDATFQGDRRKDVEVSVQMKDGTTKQVTLSMTKESGKYLVCGF